MYQVEFDPEAEQDLAGLNRAIAQRILKKLKWLAENFELSRPERLHKRLRGMYKLRVGDHRVIYTVSDTGARFTGLRRAQLRLPRAKRSRAPAKALPAQ